MTFRIYALLVTLILDTAAYGADFVVVTNSDSGPGSLRQAILDANAAGGGQITFSNVGALIILSNQLPALTSSIQILGPGVDQLALNGKWVFTNVFGNDTVLGGLKFTNCRSAIINLGTMLVTNCVMADGRLPFQDAPPEYALGIYNAGTLIASNCTLSGNFGAQNRNGVAINNAGTMSLAHCTITNNRISFGSGCGIFNTGDLTADFCTIAGNSGNDCDGSGLSNDAGSAILRNCSVNYNGAFGAGGIWNGAWLAMTNCTLAGNSASYSDGPEEGGGLYNHGYALLYNATISGNRAGPSGLGGGIWNDGLTVLVNSTVASNRVTGCSGGYPRGAGIWNSGAVRSVNSIIAGNVIASSCPGQGADFVGNLDSLGNNLLQDSSGWTNVGTGTGDIVGLDPMLGPLQDNGGPTWTHALLPGSPAIDAGYSNPYDYSYNAQNEDQRGIPRPQGVAVDIGSFEFQFTAPIFMRVGRYYSDWHFQASAPPLKSYMVQYSTNLTTWVDWGTQTATSNGVIDVSADTYLQAAHPNLFFRLKSQSP